jgi:orotate phosphoribosyltransferase
VTSTQKLQDLFTETGALLKGHFLLSSGLHSDQYMQCALLLARPSVAEELGASLGRLCDSKPDLVISPAMGGLIIGQEVARALGVRHYFFERGQDNLMTLRRGFTIDTGERVALVEDVVTTGKSSREVSDLIAERGGRVVSWLSVVNRSGASPAIGTAALKSLLSVSIPSYKPEQCPLCKEGKPVVKPGSRKQ